MGRHSFTSNRKTPDRNQPAIVAVIEELGGQAVDLSRVGKGVPDLLVSYGFQVALAEVKRPETLRKLLGKTWEEKPVREWLRAEQWSFITRWAGCPVYVLTTEEDARAMMSELGEGVVLPRAELRVPRLDALRAGNLNEEADHGER